MKLEILTPESVIYSGETESVTLPGATGSFQILHNHAPIISSLVRGMLTFTHNGESQSIEIADGLVAVSANKITVCIDKTYSR